MSLTWDTDPADPPPADLYAVEPVVLHWSDPDPQVEVEGAPGVLGPRTHRVGTGAAWTVGAVAVGALIFLTVFPRWLQFLTAIPTLTYLALATTKPCGVSLTRHALAWLGGIWLDAVRAVFIGVALVLVLALLALAAWSAIEPAVLGWITGLFSTLGHTLSHSVTSSLPWSH